MIEDPLLLLKSNESLYNNYPEDLKNLRKRIQAEIRSHLKILDSQPLILNGHQTLFFHPGILSKELISNYIAKTTGGTSISIILDHDNRDIVFSAPLIYNIANEKRIKKNTYLLGAQNNYQKKITSINIGKWIDHLESIQNNLVHHYPENVQKNLVENLEILGKNATAFDDLTNYISNCRRESLQKLQVSFQILKVSELSELDGWKEFCQIINASFEKFNRVHNQALQSYRKLHHIKNHAQPVSDLKPDELPFWVKRPDYVRQKATIQDISGFFLPRAITLSIFLRLFVADIFIHGTGGARYDQVTNAIIRNFFNVYPSDFIGKTATIQLPLDQIQEFSYYKNLKNLGEWTNEFRNFIFHPEKVLGVEHDLCKERSNLINSFYLKKGNKKSIHDNLEKNRQQILKLLSDYQTKLQSEKLHIKKYLPDKNTLFDRTFPYFFYDLSNLIADKTFLVHRYSRI